jgi:hypothetical protein
MTELKLKKAIVANECTLDTLVLDFDSLSTADMKQAQSLRGLISDSKQVDATRMYAPLRIDPEFQIAVGWVAACKGTAGLSNIDFLKLGLVDAMALGEAASDFLLD